MRRQLLQGMYLGLAGLLSMPLLASAQQTLAYTAGPVNLRAGPARDYPLVTPLPGGVPVTVMGCISDYSWCDVALPNARGWVYAGHLSYPYQGANVPVLTYGTTLGLPIVTFSIGAYWGNYYRGRPWYRDQSRWAHRPPPRPAPIRPPNRPPPGAIRPPGGARPPGPGNGARPPGPGNGARPPGNGGGRPPANGGGRPGGDGGRPGGDGGKPGGGRPGGDSDRKAPN